ncbi:MAG: hydrogenase small subunit [Clostridiales bacterium]
MKINRRQFLLWSVAAGIAIKTSRNFDTILYAAEDDPPIIWLQGAGCTGCTISTLNLTSPTTIDDLLLNQVSMKYNNTIMSSYGELAISDLEEAANNYSGKFILVAEGSVPTGESENFCTLGMLGETELTMKAALLNYGPLASYVVSAGTCSSYGGIAKASPNGSFVGVSNILSGKTTNPVINLPGCPVQPTVLVETLLDLILTGIPAVDSENRPTEFYGKSVHQSCERRSYSRTQIGEAGCYRSIGCRGPSTYFNACPSLKWNNGQSFCVTSNYPCIGCATSDFPTNPLLDT